MTGCGAVCPGIIDAVVPLSDDVVTTYPPRGPLQQYRLNRATPFDCVRCGSQKTSKLHTVVDSDPGRLLCNGCYGRLLALWDLKAGSLPDADRDDAILSLLDAMVTFDQVQHARERLARLPEFDALHPATQQVLATSEAVTSSLRGATGLDWSAAIIGLCKAVEIELSQRLLEPLRGAATGVDLGTDLIDRDLSRLAKYCAGRAPSPELGATAYVLRVAANSKKRAASSPILIALAALTEAWEGGAWVLAVNGLSQQLDDVCKTYRNPAAHTSILNEQDFNDCVRLIRAPGGLLDQLVSTLR